MRIAPGSRLLFIGDSVTDCGRARPVGEGGQATAGNGYVALVDALLMAAYPAHAIRVSNTGISGNTVRDLKARWRTDVLDLKPQWLAVMIGINDVWRQFDRPRLGEQAVPLAEYEATLDALVAQTTGLQGLVLMTPFFIESSTADAMRRRMDEYGAAVRRIATKHRALFVDTQAAFDRALASMHSSAIAWDRIHPNHIGHMVLARAFLDAVGFAWNGAAG